MEQSSTFDGLKVILIGICVGFVLYAWFNTLYLLLVLVGAVFIVTKGEAGKIIGQLSLGVAVGIGIAFMAIWILASLKWIALFAIVAGLWLAYKHFVPKLKARS